MRKTASAYALASRLVFLAALCGEHLFDFSKTGPERIRGFFEDAGGAFIKLGQILSMRHDLLPARYTHELKKLLAHVPTFSFSEMEDLFARETGENIHSFFAQVSHEPVASASVGQVYKGIYFENGAPMHVAIKIQRPGVVDAFERDFLIIRFFAGLCESFFIFKSVSLTDAAREFISWTRRELDFTVEATHSEKLRASQSEGGAVIPRVVAAYPKVLITEFLHGAWSLEEILVACATDPFFVSDFHRKTGIHLRAVGERFIKEQMRQYFVDGFFHADPHPGNIFLLHDGRLAYLDAGIAGDASVKRGEFARSLHAISTKNIPDAGRYFLAFARNMLEESIGSVPEKYGPLMEKITEIVTIDFSRELERIITPWYAAMERRATFFMEGNSDKSSAVALARILLMSRSYHIRLPEDLVLFFRSLSIADQVALALDPSFDMMAAMRLFFDEFSLEDIASRASAQDAVLPLAEVLDELSYEQLMELKQQEKESAEYTREKMADIAFSYAEKYPEILELLKTA